MKLTKNIITRDEAFKLAPIYVAFIEKGVGFTKVDKATSKLKKGQSVITWDSDTGSKKGQYVKCKVSSVITDDIRAVDGPVVRVDSGEYTWRVDGCYWAYPIKG